MNDRATQRVVGRRAVARDPMTDSARLQRTLNRLRGAGLVPRGVYRFARHEDADRWMNEQIAASRERLRSKTSSRSAEPSIPEGSD